MGTAVSADDRLDRLILSKLRFFLANAALNLRPDSSWSLILELAKEWAEDSEKEYQHLLTTGWEPSPSQLRASLERAVFRVRRSFTGVVPDDWLESHLTEYLSKLQKP